VSKQPTPDAPATITTEVGELRLWKWWCPDYGDLSYSQQCTHGKQHKPVYVLERDGEGSRER